MCCEAAWEFLLVFLKYLIPFQSQVETIGDCYFVAGGLIAEDEDGFMTAMRDQQPDPLHAKKVFDFARVSGRGGK